MASGHASTSYSSTFTGTTADRVTIDQLWSYLQVTNRDSVNTLWIRQDGTTTPADAVAAGSGCTPVLPLQTAIIAGTATPSSTVVISVVGDGGGYTVAGVNAATGTVINNYSLLDARYEQIGTSVAIGSLVINVKDYGAVGDGTADDTAEIQAAVTACPDGGTVYFPPGRYLITTPITVSTSISLQGSNYYQTYLIAVACGGLIIDKIDNVAIRNLGVYLAVRYTTTVNALIGIDVRGDPANQPFNHVYEDVYVDGFKTALKTNNLWAAKIDNFRCNNGLIGIDAYGSSVNVEVSKCAIGVAAVTNSRGIRFNGDVASEGWIIADTVIDGADIGVHGTANVHIYIHDTIIDHCLTYGVLIEDNATNFGGVWDIHDCYIGMTGAAGVAAIRDTNTIVNAQNLGHRIHHNTILAYTGSTCVRGVHLSGAAVVKAIVEGNTLNNFTTADLEAVVGNACKAFGNNCLSAITNNVIGFDLVDHNTGVVSGTNIRANAPARRLISTIDPVEAVASSSIGSNNRGCYYQVKDGGAITKVGYEVVNPAGNICIAHYANSGVGRSAVPGARIATTGAFACPGAGYQERALATTIQPGDWLFISGDDGTASFRALANFASISDLFKGASGLEAAAHPAPSSAGMTVGVIGPICLIGVP